MHSDNILKNYKINLFKYKIVDYLGKGSYSDVHSVMCKRDGKMFAAKIMNEDHNKEDKERFQLREIEILSLSIMKQS